MILIIGGDDDDHVRLVTDRLGERGAAYFRFDPRDFPTAVELTVEYDRTGAARRYLNSTGNQLDLAQLRAVWHRSRARPVPYANLEKDQSWWAAESCARFLSELYECLDCLWVPEKPASERAWFRPDAEQPAFARWQAQLVRQQSPSPENKLYQLSVAGRLGFSVPRTLITNSPERFFSFYDACDGELISKRTTDLAPLVGGEPTRPFTVSVERRDAADSAAIRHCPVVFQEKIAKRVELRVTVVGSKVFAAEIRSQESLRQTTDWRHAPEYAQSRFYAVHVLPAPIEDRCVRLVEALGLSFGALDLILTPDDEYVFLEVNMKGQWAYIEEMLGLPISDAIAELLINR